ncbi:MAG: hypothetical protein J0G98_14120 [Terrimonas ferruginea]|jgi:hypothetical protein|uniref:hypothetical protein n=1 Tax=Terrimonas ferruginea TaxID=249 RepID=UPI001AD12BE6|nr:hypothetical protein [Terrimonas ferruginea]MBN8784192.1 hypothetical protein [Terrimonas ferruginea]
MKIPYLIIAVLILPLLYKRMQMLYRSVKEKNTDQIKVNLVFLFAMLVVSAGIVGVVL